jgi:histidine triad (HIT) family protein
MSEQSLFTKIINGEISAHKIYEDDKVIAFLTIHPLCDGHTLVVPKKQIDQIWDLESNDYKYLWGITQMIALHLRDIMKVERIGVVIKGFEVPHAHIHLIPVPYDTHIDFDPEPSPSIVDNEKLASIADLIRL